MRRPSPVDADTDRLTGVIVDAAFEVHRTLGPGLLESAYAACMRHELMERGIVFRSEVALPVLYKGEQLDAAFRLDLLVADRVVVELKAVEEVLPIHVAQLLTYLKLSGCRVGLLVNFKVTRMTDGIRRLVW
ncbi:MAG: GxxExxY protein [Candidatus Rokuibacteriota bacterium]